MNRNNSTACLLQSTLDMQHFQPQAEDILTDEDLLELFRIVKQIIRKKPDAERIAKLFFCIVYAMGDLYHFYKPIHSDCIVFRDESNVNAPVTADVQLPTSVSCCQGVERKDDNSYSNTNSPTSQSQAVPQRLLSVSYLTNPTPTSQQQQIKPNLPQIISRPTPLGPPTTAVASLADDETTTDQYSVRPYTNIRPIYPSSSSPSSSSSSVSNNHHNYPLIQPQQSTSSPTWTTILPSTNEQQQQQQINRYPHLNTLMNNTNGQQQQSVEILMEPKQRGFYYQDGRITREPALLQRYAEQGVLTQASLMRKRKKPFGEGEFPYELSTIPAPAIKKPKIPHRHGEFKQRRDDIISRMRTIMMADLEQKAQRLPSHFTLGIEKAELPNDINIDNLITEEASNLLAPALRILTLHSNMKPHLDNGMNQNGIYYNNDYFRLYLAFVQFQNIFAELFPNEVIKITSPPLITTPVTANDDTTTTTSSPGGSMTERDKDRERNANMKAYRGWIEPFLTETNWAAFRRNIMVGERIMQLTKVVGQGVLLMTKELSGSKLHLTFTNNEWEEFIQGLSQGLWDETIDWSHDELDQENNNTTATTEREGTSLLVTELRLKFATHFWFTEQGKVVAPAERKAARARERQNSLMNKQ